MSVFRPTVASIPTSTAVTTTTTTTITIKAALPLRVCSRLARPCKRVSSLSRQQAVRRLSTARDFPTLPYRFDTGVALFAKRAPRPFPPPFLSPPSGSFSDPLSTHHKSRDRRARINGEIILGKTNGDDAVFESEHFICANDGVGAWSTRPRGHAGLWSRLILHFWANALREDASAYTDDSLSYTPNPVAYLQKAYESTVKATAEPINWQGTTTACGAQIHFKSVDDGRIVPMVYVTNLGDCQVMVLRPKEREVIYKTTEQWHWFDCPRQLGTNSPDTPEKNAVVDEVELRVGDVVLAMTDGVIDNLWEHEIVENVRHSLERWERGEGGKIVGDRTDGANGGMKFAAEELVTAAKNIALDPFAESPFMEHAIEEGLAGMGGKLDDISVVAALVAENELWDDGAVSKGR